VSNALRSAPYRRFWLGSLAANLGLWIQVIALGWLVYDLTRKAGWLGAVSFIGNMPTLVLGLIGGVIVDRTSLRVVMTSALLVLAASAVTLASLTQAGAITIWWVLILAVVSGSASAFYTPAMHALVPTLVEGETLLSAVSLNAVQFNLARALGPALAGLLYPRIGPAGCFALNAMGFLVLTVILAPLRMPVRTVVAPPSLGHALGEGIRYVRGHALIAPALALAAVLSLCGFPYIILLPALARDTLHLDASGLGFLMASMGGGAVVGGLAVSWRGSRTSRPRLIATGATLFGVALMGFEVTDTPRATALLLVMLGVLQTVTIATLTASVQIAVDDGMRGRVMSMLAALFFGFSTLGGLVLGIVGDHIGVPHALALGGLATTGFAAPRLVRHHRASRHADVPG
jgi:predicted MFS family arabinose efflux permease